MAEKIEAPSGRAQDDDGLAIWRHDAMPYVALAFGCWLTAGLWLLGGEFAGFASAIVYSVIAAVHVAFAAGKAAGASE